MERIAAAPIAMKTTPEANICRIKSEQRGLFSSESTYFVPKRGWRRRDRIRRRHSSQELAEINPLKKLAWQMPPQRSDEGRLPPDDVAQPRPPRLHYF